MTWLVKKHLFHKLTFEQRSDKMRKDLCGSQQKEFQAMGTKIETFKAAMCLVFYRID